MGARVHRSRFGNLVSKVKLLVALGVAGVIGYRIHQLGWREVERGLIDQPMEVLVPKASKYLSERPDGKVTEAIRQLVDILDA